MVVLTFFMFNLFLMFKVKAGQTADLLSSLKKLENCLKSEGSYKNVKVGFETAKADVNEVSKADFLKKKWGEGGVVMTFCDVLLHINNCK